MQMTSKSNMLTVVLCLFTYSILFAVICGENFLNFHPQTPKMAEKSSVKNANYMNDLISITNGPIT
jgi:hypothetical protein